jgi:hypothetical protein
MAPLIESVRREAGFLQYVARGVTFGRAPFPHLRLTALLIFSGISRARLLTREMLEIEKTAFVAETGGERRTESRLGLGWRLGGARTGHVSSG